MTPRGARSCKSSLGCEEVRSNAGERAMGGLETAEIILRGAGDVEPARGGERAFNVVAECPKTRQRLAGLTDPREVMDKGDRGTPALEMQLSIGGIRRCLPGLVNSSRSDEGPDVRLGNESLGTAHAKRGVVGRLQCHH